MGETGGEHPKKLSNSGKDRSEANIGFKEESAVKNKMGRKKKEKKGRKKRILTWTRKQNNVTKKGEGN